MTAELATELADGEVAARLEWEETAEYTYGDRTFTVAALRAAFTCHQAEDWKDGFKAAVPFGDVMPLAAAVAWFHGCRLSIDGQTPAKEVLVSSPGYAC